MRTMAATASIAVTPMPLRATATSSRVSPRGPPRLLVTPVCEDEVTAREGEKGEEREWHHSVGDSPLNRDEGVQHESRCPVSDISTGMATT